MNDANRAFIGANVEAIASKYGDGIAGMAGLTGGVIGWYVGGSKAIALGAAIGFGVGFAAKVVALEYIVPSLRAPSDA